jgi:hypothetical protein
MRAIYVSWWFALLAAIFLALYLPRGTPPDKKAWRRIGIIFALVALVIFVIRPG